MASKKKKTAVKKAKAQPKKPAPKRAPPKKAVAKKRAPAKKAVVKKRARAKKAVAKKVAPKKVAPRKPGPFSFEIIEQLEHFSASPEVIYRTWLASSDHSDFTNSKATIDARVGGAFNAYDGYISGVTTELVENERIVQRWRAADFPGGYPDSKVELTLTPHSGGTRLRLRHSSVPAKNAKAYDSGWHVHYWQPLRAHLASRGGR